MNQLEEKILKDVRVIGGRTLVVDDFLNHCVDMDIMRQIAYEIRRRFAGERIDKILTIEASGIALGTMIGSLLEASIVFAKKRETLDNPEEMYVAQAKSISKGIVNQVFISKQYINADERVLIVDDFIANGESANALTEIVRQAGAQVVGVAAAIEKGNLCGGDALRAKGYRVEAIAIIDSIAEDGSIRLRRQEEVEVGKETDADHNTFMQMAIEEARKGITEGHGGPFGSVIVKEGKIIAMGHNMVLRNNDPTAHGEMVAIRKASENLGSFDLSGCTLYTTGEPCHMCLCAIMWANIKQVYYGCTIADNGIIGFRDDKFNDIFGGRERLGSFLTELDRDKCLDLFQEYLNTQHKGY